ncbi:MAG: hypothetical protein M3Y13_11515, partial [Armatimonadota bacterium]|nr:hypothetical protein [Armatimonadota bacterium]
MNHHSLLRVSACAAALAAGAALTGCSGVVKNLNSNQVNIPNIKVANPFGFSNQTANVTFSNQTGAIAAAHTALKPHA